MNVHDSTSRAHDSVCVTISHEQDDWSVSVPVRLCKQETASMEQLMQLVLQAGPVSVQDQGLQLFTFNKSPWTQNNLEALVHDRRIILAHDGKIKCMSKIPVTSASAPHYVTVHCLGVTRSALKPLQWGSCAQM